MTPRQLIEHALAFSLGAPDQPTRHELTSQRDIKGATGLEYRRAELVATGNPADYPHLALLHFHAGVDHGWVREVLLRGVLLDGNGIARHGIKGYVGGTREARFDGLYLVRVTSRNLGYPLILDGGKPYGEPADAPNGPCVRNLCVIDLDHDAKGVPSKSPVFVQVTGTWAFSGGRVVGCKAKDELQDHCLYIDVQGESQGLIENMTLDGEVNYGINLDGPEDGTTAGEVTIEDVDIVGTMHGIDAGNKWNDPTKGRIKKLTVRNCAIHLRRGGSQSPGHLFGVSCLEELVVEGCDVRGHGSLFYNATTRQAVRYMGTGNSDPRLNFAGIILGEDEPSEPAPPPSDPGDPPPPPVEPPPPTRPALTLVRRELVTTLKLPDGTEAELREPA